MKNTITILSLVFFTGIQLFSQNKTATPAETNQFDFWIGDWEATWSDSLKGSNVIAKEMNGNVVHEKFSDPKNKYKGESWSVYDAGAKKWRQTWVDNGGAFMVFEGGMKDGKMELSFDKIDKDGKPVTMSMIFYNITANDFDWDWRQTYDKGKTWKSLWKIHYKRRLELITVK